MKYPSKVVHEITKNKCVTKIFDQNNKLLGTLTNKRDDSGFSRKTKAFEEKYPEFMSEVDGFHCTDVANQLKDFAQGCHRDLDRSEE
jgi:hypothetical protein